MAKSKKVSSLETKIKDAGLDWEPRDTPISKLSKADQDLRLGLEINESEMARVQQLVAQEAQAPRTISYASKTDWRTKHDKNWITDVQDQGNCGSCVAFAAVATSETQTRIQEKKHDGALDLSESELFFCGGRSCSQGWWPNEALDYLLNTGCSDEQCFPYTDQDTNCNTCDDRETRYLKIGEWKEITSIDERKQWLDQNGPLVACMAVYRDFFSYSDGVYRPVSTDSSELAGYHAICCIGYDEEEQCWICKNSWGKDWGNKGFFKIGYDSCEINTSFAMYGVSRISGPLVDQLHDEETESYAWADYTVLEDAFESSQMILWAYADNKWRHKILSPHDTEETTNIVESSDSLQVRYHGDEIVCVHGWRSYEKRGALEQTL